MNATTSSARDQGRHRGAGRLTPNPGGAPSRPPAGRMTHRALAPQDRVGEASLSLGIPPIGLFLGSDPELCGLVTLASEAAPRHFPLKRYTILDLHRVSPMFPVYSVTYLPGCSQYEQRR
jgi:hypothetical protein